MELVRYIHLNLLRAKLVADMKELGKNRYSGHGVLLGNVVAGWQNTKYILRLFGSKLPVARQYYREFVQKGVAAGRRRELTGGGLIRSIGGWSAAKLLRKAGALQKGDERILGDGKFVEKVLAQAKVAFELTSVLQHEPLALKANAEIKGIPGRLVTEAVAADKMVRLYGPRVR